jgi:ClpP class serine protease
MLLRSDVAEKLGRLHKSGVAPTAKQREEFAAARAARPKLAATLPGARPMASGDPENYAVVGSVAQICIEGVLSEEPDFWAWLFGMDGSTYSDIRDGLALAAADPLVKSVVFDVSSPGGYCDGLFETLAAIEAFNKPIAVQSSQACSAAYALSAMGGPITAIGPASEFGSIGVAIAFAFDADTEIVNLTSTEAPNKRPDPRTPEGKAVIVAELDAVHELFVDAIARGRSSATGKTYTVDQVNADFGRGGTMLADAAKSAGLIDKMPRAVKRAGSNAADESPAPVASDAAPEQPSPPRSTGQQKPKVKPMTEEELLAQFPHLHAAVTAKGASQGQAAERKRVLAHVKMGKSSGAPEIAEKAIASGASLFDEEVFADYQSAMMGKRETSARQEESDEVGKILKGSAPSEGAKDMGDQIVDLMDAQAGKKKAS